MQYHIVIANLNHNMLHMKEQFLYTYVLKYDMWLALVYLFLKSNYCMISVSVRQGTSQIQNNFKGYFDTKEWNVKYGKVQDSGLLVSQFSI